MEAIYILPNETNKVLCKNIWLFNLSLFNGYSQSTRSALITLPSFTLQKDGKEAESQAILISPSTPALPSLNSFTTRHCFPGTRREGPRAPGRLRRGCPGVPLTDKAERGRSAAQPCGPRRRRGHTRADPGLRAPAPEAAGAEAEQQCPGPGREGRTAAIPPRWRRRRGRGSCGRRARHTRTRPPCSSRRAISYLIGPDPARRFPLLQAASHCAPAAAISPPPPPQSPQLSGPSIHLGPGRPPPPSLAPALRRALRKRSAAPAPPARTNGGRPAPVAQPRSENSALRSPHAPRPPRYERKQAIGGRSRVKGERFARRPMGRQDTATAEEPPGAHVRARSLPSPAGAVRALGRPPRAGGSRALGRGAAGARRRWGEGSARHLGSGVEVRAVGASATEAGLVMGRRVWGSGVVLSHGSP